MISITHTRHFCHRCMFWFQKLMPNLLTGKWWCKSYGTIWCYCSLWCCTRIVDTRNWSQILKPNVAAVFSIICSTRCPKYWCSSLNEQNHKRIYAQLFSLMLHKNASDKFSFENCKFTIQRSKESTGRFRNSIIQNKAFDTEALEIEAFNTEWDWWWHLFQSGLLEYGHHELLHSWGAPSLDLKNKLLAEASIWTPNIFTFLRTNFCMFALKASISIFHFFKASHGEPITLSYLLISIWRRNDNI